MVTSLNVPGLPHVPIAGCGVSAFHDLFEPIHLAGDEPECRHLVRTKCERFLVGIERFAPEVRQPSRVQLDDRTPGVALRHALAEHLRPHETGNSDTRGARPEEREALGAERLIEDSTRRNRTPAMTTAAVPWMSSLKLVVGEPVAVQQADRIVLLEVLPLEHGVREDLRGPLRRREPR